MTTFRAFVGIVLIGVATNFAAAAEPRAGAGAEAPALADAWAGAASWTPDGENIGAAFAFHFPSILPRGREGELWAYYITNGAFADGSIKIGVGRARSRDGLAWTDDGPVLEPVVGDRSAWDDRIASFPSVWKDGDTWYMVYEGASHDPALSPGDIGLATSTDGRHFTRHPNNPILRHQPTGWERANIGTPSLYKEGDTWYLFYHGYDWNVCQVGVASGTSLTNLKRADANPILPVSAKTDAWDCGTIGRRSAIVKEGGHYYFAFEGSSAQPFQHARWSTGLARSTSLTSGWEKLATNPVIPTTKGGFGYDGPELSRGSDGRLHLYVRAPGANATNRFALEWSDERDKPSR